MTITANELGSTPLVLAVRAEGGNDAIEFLRVEVNDPGAPSGGRVEVFVEDDESSDRLVRVQEVKRISHDNINDGELWIRLIETDLNATGGDGNIGLSGTTRGGLIEAERIFDVLAAGHITANIKAENTIGSEKGIDEIRADGDLLGLSVETDGRIGRIEAGEIGDDLYPSGTAIESEVEIGNIVAGEIGRADIIVASGSTPRPIRRIECGNLLLGKIDCSTPTDDVAGTGDPGVFLSGALPALDAGIFIRGALEAPIEVAGMSGLIWLADDLPVLSGTDTITTDSLSGLIIVNGANSGGEWLGSVRVDDVVLSPDSDPPDEAPFYTRPSIQLGLGAVGLAPFHLYEADCAPAPCAAVESVPNDETVLRWYGPVTWNPQHVPLIIEVSVPFSENCPPTGLTFFDMTEDFTIEDGGARTLVISPISPSVHFIAGAIYRVRPAVLSGVRILRCDRVTGDPEVADFTYFVRIESE